MAGLRRPKAASPGNVPLQSGEAENRRFLRFAAILAGFVGTVLLIILVIVCLRPPDDSGVNPGNAPPSGETAGAGAAFTLPASPPEMTGDQLRQEGEQAIQDLLADFPKSPDAMHAAAILYLQLQQTAGAERLWQECIALAPRHGGAHAGLAIVAMTQGNNELAVERARHALAIGCSSAELYLKLADALTKLGQLQDAEEVLQRSLVEYPESPENLLLLGRTQTQLGKFAEAEKSLRKTLELDPEWAQVHFALATACARQGKRDEAAHHHKRFAELRPKDPSAMGEERYQVAYLAALRRTVSASLGRAGAVYYRSGDSSKAERLLLRAIAVNPPSVENYRILAALCRDRGRVADARTLYRRLTQLEPQDYTNHVNLASLSAELGDVDSAESALKQAMLVKPDAALPRASLAQLCLNTGRLREARSLVEEAIRREPAAEWYLLLAAVCEQLGDRAGAVAAVDMARKLTPNDPRRIQGPRP